MVTVSILGFLVADVLITNLSMEDLVVSPSLNTIAGGSTGYRWAGGMTDPHDISRKDG